MTQKTCNTEFVVLQPDGSILVHAQRLVDPRNRYPEPEDTEWKLEPRFYSGLGTWEQYREGPIVIRGEGLAREKASTLATLVAQSNQAMVTTQLNHIDAIKEWSPDAEA